MKHPRFIERMQLLLNKIQGCSNTLNNIKFYYDE